MPSSTACPLDCYDACEVVYENDKIKAKKGGHTQGFLCPNLNHFDKYQRITTPSYKGKSITMPEALEKLKELLDENPKSETLHYKGHGNFGLMQDVTEHAFAQLGCTLTDGTLCDGAGEAGILEGRGSNKNMTIQEIAKSEVVIFWGRNPHSTSSHLLPLIKDKTIIVIDPLRTKIAQNADLFIQLKPHTDMYLAMLLSRFVYINDMGDDEYLEEYASEFEEYYELTQTIRIKSMLDSMGLSLGQIGDILELVKDKKVAIVCGVGIQKYRDGADVMRAIDAFGVSLGLFAKEGSGIAYLGASKAGIDSPFNTKAKRVSKVNTAFDEFKTVIIQGSNPLSQMPDSVRVKNSISQTKNVVYFGLYENESSAVADLIIPAKTFLEKNDIRVSYSHDAMIDMPQQIESEIGISEYELAAFISETYELELQSEAEYIEHFKSFSIQDSDENRVVKGRETLPYKEGFDTDDGEFLFLEEIEIDKGLNKIKMRKRKKVQKKSDELYLITPKSAKSLNSQFNVEENVYLHSSLGYEEGSEIKISSQNGTVSLKLIHNDNLRDDCVLIYSGTSGVNNLTSSEHSYEGKSAIYQENRVEITTV